MGDASADLRVVAAARDHGRGRDVARLASVLLGDARLLREHRVLTKRFDAKPLVVLGGVAARRVFVRSAAPDEQEDGREEPEVCRSGRARAVTRS